MFTAIIENEGNTLVMEFPCKRYLMADHLGSIGIRKPAHEKQKHKGLWLEPSGNRRTIGGPNQYTASYTVYHSSWSLALKTTVLIIRGGPLANSGTLWRAKGWKEPARIASLYKVPSSVLSFTTIFCRLCI